VCDFCFINYGKPIMIKAALEILDVIGPRKPHWMCPPKAEII
jgi:hypothetical protein